MSYLRSSEDVEVELKFSRHMAMKIFSTELTGAGNLIVKVALEPASYILEALGPMMPCDIIPGPDV